MAETFPDDPRDAVEGETYERDGEDVEVLSVTIDADGALVIETEVAA